MMPWNKRLRPVSLLSLLLIALPGCAAFWGGVSDALDEEEQAALLTFLPPLSAAVATNDSEPGANVAEQRLIFVSASTVDGDLNDAPSLMGSIENTGVDEADFLCNEDNNRPDPERSYLALLVDGGLSRAAANEPNCGSSSDPEADCLGQKNWVLAPNTRYVRGDGRMVFQTNPRAIVPGGTNDLWGVGAGFNTERVWTGLNQDWTSAPDHCLEWDRNETFERGRFGEGHLPGIQLISAEDDSECDQSNALICVEVP